MEIPEDSDTLLMECQKIQRSGGESTLKEFLAEAYHLGFDHGSDFVVSQSEDGGLYKIPARIRIKIWKLLDQRSLLSVSQTCTTFKEEVLMVQSDEENAILNSPLQQFMNVLPFVPLNRYLDPATRNTLRLVCKTFKIIMDFYDDIDRRPSYRWGRVNDASPLSSSSSNHLELEPSDSKVDSILNIFDLHIQVGAIEFMFKLSAHNDLKRIFSQLDQADLISVQSVCHIFNRIVTELEAYPFEEYRESLFQLNLMDLPFEVHKEILNYCNCNDRQTLRLVSKLMQYQVDTLAGVEVHLNDLKWAWNTSCGKLPPAYSLIISNVENIQAIRYFTNEDNCSLLTRIVLDGKFPAKAFVHLLEQCKNLRYIGFTHALQMGSIEDEIGRSFPIKRLPLQLPSLRALNLKIQEEDCPSDNIFRVHSWTWANAFEIMKMSMFYIPQLTSFHICEETIITHNLMHEVAEKVLKFIFQHRHTLKYVSIVLNGNCLRSCSCPSFLFQTEDCTLQELKLEKYSHDCDWRISRPFISILKVQRALKELLCFKLSDWEFYAGVIWNNKLSLRSVKIEKNLAPVIDLEVFSSCTNLEYLWISQYGSSKIGHQNSEYLRTIRVDQRLTNLNSLPTSIKSLHILDQTVEASQIKTIPQRLKKLEILDLQFLGSWDGKSFGMSSQTVSEILHLRKLDCVFLEEIRMLDLHLTNSFEEALSEINLIPTDCSQVLKSFGCLAYGMLIAKTLPNPGFMSEWQQRVSCYFERHASNYEDHYQIDNQMAYPVDENEEYNEFDHDEDYQEDLIDE